MVQFRVSGIEGVWQVSGRFTRAVVAFPLMGVGALAWVLASPTPAYAAGDQIDSFTINYDMQPSGVLKVKETIIWRLGSDSGRHGMQRDLVIREPDPNSDQDFVYGISNIKVTSPDPGVGNPVQLRDNHVAGRSRGGVERQNRRPEPDHLYRYCDLCPLL
jgi:hypothetical protein